MDTHFYRLGLKLAVTCTFLTLLNGPAQSQSTAPHHTVTIGNSAQEQAFYRDYWNTLLDLRQRNRPSTPSWVVQRPLASTITWPPEALIKNLRVRNLELTGANRRVITWNRRITRPVVPHSPGWTFLPFPNRPFPNRPFSHRPHPHRPYPYRGNRIINTWPSEYYVSNNRVLLRGTLTNGNAVPVTVLAVNYRILDSFDNLLQTGSLSPEPSTIAPKQTVTLQEELFNLPTANGYEVKLMNPAFVLGN
jgi:hypothetical protein